MSRYHDLKSKVETEVMTAITPIRAAIWEKYIPALAEAKRLDDEDLARYKDRVMQESLRDALWPVGTKLVEWSNAHPTNRYSSQNAPWYRTGRRGFYEIFDERKSAKVVSFLSHGWDFVRLAKKGGTPGAKIAQYVNWQTWLPQGEHPDAYEHPFKPRKLKL